MVENVTIEDTKELNRRIDQMPRLGVNYALLVLIGASYFFAFYDISAFGYSLDKLISVFHWTVTESTIPASLYLFGYIVGALIVGNIADRTGRRTGLTLTVAILTVGGILTALSWNLASFSIFRFITGMGTGAELSIAATLISEYSPARSRGRFVQLNYFWGAAGLGVAPFLILWFLGTAPSWRLVFLFGAFVGFLILIMRTKYLVESPRWLLVKGRKTEAFEILKRMEAISSKSKKPPVPVEEDFDQVVAASEKIPIIELFKKNVIFRTIIAIAFWAIWYITVYAWLGYEPYLLTTINVTLPGGLLFVAFSDLAFPVGAVVSFLVIEYSERKYIVAAIAFIFAISSFVITASYVPVVIFVGAFFGAFAIAANSAAYVYTTEMFPTRMRAAGMSFGDGAGHIGGAVAPFILLGALDLFGGRGAFLTLGIIVALSGVVALLGPKTTGLALTKSAKLKP